MTRPQQTTVSASQSGIKSLFLFLVRRIEKLKTKFAEIFPLIAGTVRNPSPTAVGAWCVGTIIAATLMAQLSEVVTTYLRKIAALTGPAPIAEDNIQ